MENGRRYQQNAYESPKDIFRVSHRELDLCHQISDESESNSSHEDHAGGNKKYWYDKENTEEAHNEIYHAKF